MTTATRAVLVLAIGLLAPPVLAQQAALEEDARVIEVLRKNGSDLSKPHRIDFFFYFQSEGSANSAAKELQTSGYSVLRVDRPANARSWNVHAQRLMVPEIKAMQGLTLQFEALARKFGGEYDGWGAPIVR